MHNIFLKKYAKIIIKNKNYFGSTLNIFDPSKAVTYKLPSVSIVKPSGKNPGFWPFILKSITTRSLAETKKPTHSQNLLDPFFTIHFPYKIFQKSEHLVD